MWQHNEIHSELVSIIQEQAHIIWKLREILADTRRKNFRLTNLYKILSGLFAVPISDILNPVDERNCGEQNKHSNTLELTPH